MENCKATPPVKIINILPERPKSYLNGSRGLAIFLTLPTLTKSSKPKDSKLFKHTQQHTTLTMRTTHTEHNTHSSTQLIQHKTHSSTQHSYSTQHTAAHNNHTALAQHTTHTVHNKQYSHSNQPAKPTQVICTLRLINPTAAFP